MSHNVITFLRKKDYILIEHLGQGACGKTVLLRDDTINEFFVCKKYMPAIDNSLEYFKNFLEEIKLLHLIYHENIIRIFNYHIYSEKNTAYILMEYVKGKTISQYLHVKPENINEIFKQTINGFMHLENNKILHRDIRPENIMVTDEDIVKIIDFGFGKKIDNLNNFEKSISINWRYDQPKDFDSKIYDYQTEIYFLAKLFQEIIDEENIEHFNYNEILKKMLSKDRDNRIASFSLINSSIVDEQLDIIEFGYYEKEYYSNFSSDIYHVITKISVEAKYIYDIDRILIKLEDLYKRTMLEEFVPSANQIIQILLSGNYIYYKKIKIATETLKNFINLLKSSSKEKRNIIFNNIHSKLDAIERYDESFHDDIPF